MKKRTKPIPVYFPNEPKSEADLIPFKYFIEPNEINETVSVHFGDLKVSFLKTDHGVPTYAMKFETKEKTFVYGADSGIHTNWLPFAQRPDLAILECTYLMKHRPETPIGHLATIDVARISNIIKPKKLLVTHFYTEYDPEEIREEINRTGVYGNLIMPSLGKVIDI